MDKQTPESQWARDVATISRYMRGDHEERCAMPASDALARLAKSAEALDGIADPSAIAVAIKTLRVFADLWPTIDTGEGALVVLLPGQRAALRQLTIAALASLARLDGKKGK